NITASIGGGLQVGAATVTLNGVTFYGNSAGLGGGIYNSELSVDTLTNVVFTANSASQLGGGLLNFGQATLMNATFSSNFSFHGGAIYNIAAAGSQASLALTNVRLSNNASTNAGGGIYNAGGAIANLTNVTLSDNFGDDFSGDNIYNFQSTM